MIKTTELSWLAGLLEGEGCFTIEHRKPHNPKLRICLSMTDKDVIQRAYNVTNLGNMYGPYKHGLMKPSYAWIVTNKQDVASIIMTLYPLMFSRRKAKIRELLQEWRTIPLDTCLRGHVKNGERSCKECKKQQDADRYEQQKLTDF